MSDQRSVMKEYRFLDQKRQSTGLSAVEQARYAQLRDLVGIETAGPARPGFDVNAAAARLRDSLLPAGMRRDPQPEVAADPEPLPPFEPALEEAPAPVGAASPAAAALEAAWEAQPFGTLDAAPAPDPLFDPASLGAEVRPQAWNPDAPGYDPNAPYDEAAWIAAGYDPNATYDWSGYSGADGQPAAGEAPLAEVPAEPTYGEAEPTYGEAEPAYGEAEPTDGVASDAVPVPEPATEARGAGEPELPFDSNAPFDHAKWFGRAPEESAGATTSEAIADAAPEPAVDLEPEPLPPVEAAEPAAPGLAAAPAASEAWFDASTAPPLEAAPAFGEYDADARGPATGLLASLPDLPPESAGLAPAGEGLPLDDGSGTPYQPAPADAAFGEYDEAATGQARSAALPFDLEAASAIEPGALPEGYDVNVQAIDPAALPPAAEVPLDAGQLFGGPEGESLPGGSPLDLGDPVQDWAPEQALEQGFQLASDGSFGELDRPARTPVPGWVSASSAAMPGWESPPALDLDAPMENAAAAIPAADQFIDDVPTIEGEELLEEVTPFEEPAAPTEPAYPEPGYTEPAPADLGSAQPASIEAAFAEHANAEPAPDPSYQGEIPPEIAAAFGEAPAEPAAPQTWAPPAAEFLPPVEAPLPPAPEGEPFVAEGLLSPAEPEPVAEEGLLSPVEPEPIFEPEPLPGPAAEPQVWIEGSHRVVLHTVDGQVKRGLLTDAALDATELQLLPQGPGQAEPVPTDNVKAIFFMLAPGEQSAAAEGKRVRVTFRDGRQVAGFSPDYQEGTIGFFMIPADTRTNTSRIWVYQAAVRQVAVS